MQDERRLKDATSFRSWCGPFFQNLLQKIEDMGYSYEIKWQRDLKPCDNSLDFACEAIWVVLNSGMREQVARKIWHRIRDCWEKGGSTSDVFNHSGKVAAIDFIWANSKELFDKYREADEKIEFLKTIPFIGNITCYHLAKNLGHDCVKPDRHLIRVAGAHGKTPDEFCQIISEETGEKKCVVDIVIWRACNLGVL